MSLHYTELSTNAGPLLSTLLGCLLQTFRKVIGEGSIGRVHLGRWQETDVAIKVLGRVLPQSPMPTAAHTQTASQMSGVDEGASSEDEVSHDEKLLNEDMALTVKTLEREVGTSTVATPPTGLACATTTSTKDFWELQLCDIIMPDMHVHVAHNCACWVSPNPCCAHGLVMLQCLLAYSSYSSNLYSICWCSPSNPASWDAGTAH